MTDQVIIFGQGSSNKLAVCVPILGCGLTIEEIAQKDVPAGSPYMVVNRDSIPIETTFFDSLIYTGEVTNPVDTNQDEVFGIWKSKWRVARDPILKRLDVEWMRALEAGNTSLCQEIVEKKEILRDVTETPLPTRLPGQTLDDYFQTVMGVWPVCLTW